MMLHPLLYTCGVVIRCVSSRALLCVTRFHWLGYGAPANDIMSNGLSGTIMCATACTHMHVSHILCKLFLSLFRGMDFQS